MGVFDNRIFISARSITVILENLYLGAHKAYLVCSPADRLGPLWSAAIRTTVQKVLNSRPDNQFGVAMGQQHLEAGAPD